jgi:rod shape determining protein RodA
LGRETNILKNLDIPLVSLYGVLIFMGWLNIYAASYNAAHPNIFDNSMEYGKQFIWVVTALALSGIVLLFEGKFFQDYAYVIYAVVIMLLILVLLVGKEVNGAKAWFGVGSFGIQPSEFAKIGVTLSLAKYLSEPGIRMQDIKTRFIAASIIIFPCILIMLQPDTGTVLVSIAFILVMYREGLSGNVLLLGLLAAVLSVVSLLMKSATFNLPFVAEPVSGKYTLMGIIVCLALLIYWAVKRTVVPRLRKPAYYLLIGGTIGSLVFINSVDYVVENVLDDHQKVRINILLGLEDDPQGAGYNVKQSKTAIGSGGFMGKGFLEGTLTKYKYVPMQSTDFIFCTVGEEWGFVGTSVVVILFVTLILRIIFVAERQRSKFTRIYAYCVACIFFMHLLINVGMAIGLAPVIGIPLPFFSYGGSSLWGFTLLMFMLIKLDADRLNIL